MNNKITAKSLVDFDLALDGDSVKLNLLDAGDRDVSIEIPLDCVNQLIMTLPDIANRAIRRRYRDSGSRLVFSLDHWQLERATDDHWFILTLATQDGFEVSFAVRGEGLQYLQTAFEEAVGTIPGTAVMH